jgi:hypothetical protein
MDMNIVTELRNAGVRLTPGENGSVRVTGNKAALERWMPVLRERKAEIIAALEGGASDDRRLCTECRHLRGEVCSIAKPGGIVDAARGYRPVRRLVRCAGFEELPTGEMTNRNHTVSHNGGRFDATEALALGETEHH